MRSRIGKYFAWIIFTGALLVAPNLIAVNNVVRANHFSWLDAFTTAAILFGPALLVVSLAVAALLALVETGTERSRSVRIRLLPGFLTLAIFLAAWLRLLRGMLKINEVEWAWLDRPLELPVAVLIAVLLCAFAPAGTARWIAGTGARIRFVSRAFAIAVVGLLGFALVEPLYRGSTGPVELPEPGPQQPHVIIVVLDALTSLDMSVYGYSLPTTPRLDEITKTWTVFENAHSTGTATTAVQPTILTGRYPYTDQWHRYGDLARAGQGFLNLPRILQAAGYETMYALGGGYSPSRYHLHTGFDRIIGGGFAAFQRPRHLVHGFPGRDLVNLTSWNPMIAEVLLSWRVGQPRRASPNGYDEPMYDTLAELFREQARPGDNTPFFAYMHGLRPHHPYLAQEFLGRFLPSEAGVTDTRSQNRHYLRAYKPADQPEVDRLRLRYDENILKADQQLGELVDTLKELKLYDQSLIVITADHGTSFTGGFQGYFSSQVRAAEHRIPLLVKFPGQTEGRRIGTAVSLVDILPTVLDVIGAVVPPEWVDGVSLLAAEQHPERAVYVTRLHNIAALDFNHVAVIQGDWKLVRRGDQELLFNLVNDPEEQANLLLQGQETALRTALEQFRRRAAFVSAGGSIKEAPLLP